MVCRYVRLVAIFHHVIGDTTHVGVHITKAVSIAVGGIMDADNESLAGAIDDNTLRRLAILLASTLDVGRATLIVIDFSAGEGVARARDSARFESVLVRACDARRKNETEWKVTYFCPATVKPLVVIEDKSLLWKTAAKSSHSLGITIKSLLLAQMDPS